MKQAYDWLKLAENSTSRKDCTLLCSNVGYRVLKLHYYHLNKGPFTGLQLRVGTVGPKITGWTPNHRQTIFGS